MELKRTAELSLCSLLKEALPDLIFFSSRGGTEDITPDWLPNHSYLVGDILRPIDHSKTHAIVVTQAGTSGATEPGWTNVIGITYGTGGQPRYLTIQDYAVSVSQDSGTPLPPFGVVAIDDAEKTLGQEETNYLQGSVVWVTRADATHISAHSRGSKRVYDALCSIGSGYDIMHRLMIHGIDVTKTDEFHDEGRQCHGDVVSFTMGCTERTIQL